MATITRRTLLAGAAGLGALGAVGGWPAQGANNPLQIGIVGKIKIPWFDNVEKGVIKAGTDLGVSASMINPATDDPAAQVRAIEGLIARKVDVVGAVPNDSKALDAVLKQAQDAGIKVVMHESPGQKNADWDIELIQEQAFGEAHLEALAEAVGGEGKYVVFVGGPTVAEHKLWADHALALQKKKYPKMQQVGDRLGVANSVEDSFKAATDQMRANPDLKGFLAFGANGPIGAGQAVTERNQIGKAIVVGTFIPSQGIKLMKSGAITRGYLWNPIDAGYAMVALGKAIATGAAIKDGIDLPGMGPSRVDAATRVIRANKQIDLNPKSIDEWAKII